jgi:hypothetical protein
MPLPRPLPVLLSLASSVVVALPLALGAIVTSPAPSVAELASPYPRRPIELVDRVRTGSSFDQFRQRLRQAVVDRDAPFLRQIAAPDISLSFGRPISIEQLNIANPNAVVWRHLERILNTGCAPTQAVDSSNEAWSCPHVAESASGDPFSDIHVVGTDVNVRSQPNTASAVVAVLSNEIVQHDPQQGARLSRQDWEAIETWDGWRPVITPEGIRGFVSSRYAYLPTGYRARFEQRQGQWIMTSFIAGD